MSIGNRSYYRISKKNYIIQTFGNIARVVETFQPNVKLEPNTVEDYPETPEWLVINIFSYIVSENVWL